MSEFQPPNWEVRGPNMCFWLQQLRNNRSKKHIFGPRSVFVFSLFHICKFIFITQMAFRIVKINDKKFLRNIKEIANECLCHEDILVEGEFVSRFCPQHKEIYSPPFVQERPRVQPKTLPCTLCNTDVDYDTCQRHWHFCGLKYSNKCEAMHCDICECKHCGSEDFIGWTHVNGSHETRQCRKCGEKRFCPC